MRFVSGAVVFWAAAGAAPAAQLTFYDAAYEWEAAIGGVNNRAFEALEDVPLQTLTSGVPLDTGVTRITHNDPAGLGFAEITNGFKPYTPERDRHYFDATFDGATGSITFEFAHPIRAFATSIRTGNSGLTPRALTLTVDGTTVDLATRPYREFDQVWADINLAFVADQTFRKITFGEYNGLGVSQFTMADFLFSRTGAPNDNGPPDFVIVPGSIPDGPPLPRGQGGGGGGGGPLPISAVPEPAAGFAALLALIAIRGRKL